MPKCTPRTKRPCELMSYEPPAGVAVFDGCVSVSASFVSQSPVSCFAASCLCLAFVSCVVCVRMLFSRLSPSRRSAIAVLIAKQAKIMNKTKTSIQDFPRWCSRAPGFCPTSLCVSFPS